MSFHGQFIAEIARQLSPRLRPKYVALMDERVTWDSADDDVWIDAVEARPDVGIVEYRPSPQGPDGSVFIAPLTMPTLMPTLVTQRSIEIRDVAERRLVWAIEVMSPTNKHGRGYRKYLLKRGRILQSSAHLIEIDLLRNGHRVPMARPLPARPYFAFVGRAHQRPSVGVWPIRLADQLPTIPVPLLAPDADVGLNLQEAIGRVYDAVGYDLILNYAAPPSVPLHSEETEWAERRLREGMAGGSSINDGG